MSSCSNSACTRACYGRSEPSSIAPLLPWSHPPIQNRRLIPMAHSPIFQEVRRALRAASWLEQTRTGTAEGIDRMQAARWNRRRFLRTTLAAAAGASLAPVFRAPAKGPQAPKVVIIGAGTAGLVCAYRLQEKGIAARVIEASTRVGGRMFSLRNFFPD